MAEVKREHRQRAFRWAYAGIEPATIPNAWQAWLETGDPPNPQRLFAEIIERAHDRAQLDADAEERGYAACKADILAMMRSTGDDATGAYLDIEEDLHVGKAMP